MIVLASRSPQRRALIASLQIPFRVVASGYDEAGHDPARECGDVLQANADGKAHEVATRVGVPAQGAVVGADTGVVIDGRLLGKPADADEAAEMIATLAGREHEVITALSVIGRDDRRRVRERTLVRMRPLSRAGVAWYVGRGEWRERAGGYAIQGAGCALVSDIVGDWANVVGLPVARLVDELERVGVAPWQTTAQ